MQKAYFSRRLSHIFCHFLRHRLLRQRQSGQQLDHRGHGGCPGRQPEYQTEAIANESIHDTASKAGRGGARLRFHPETRRIWKVRGRCRRGWSHALPIPFRRPVGRGGVWRGRRNRRRIRAVFHNFSTIVGRKGMYLEDLFILPEKRSPQPRYKLSTPWFFELNCLRNRNDIEIFDHYFFLIVWMVEEQINCNHILPAIPNIRSE